MMSQLHNIYQRLKMRLMISYKGITKTMRQVKNFDQIIKFVNQNFFLKMSKWSMSYIDADGDLISLDSDLDVQTMMQTLNGDHVKVYIKDLNDSHIEQPKQIAQQVNIDSIDTYKLKKQEEPEKVHQIPHQIKINENKIVQICQQKVIDNSGNNGEGYNGCHGRGQWRKKIQQKMAKFVDQRLQSLIPYITKKVQEKIQNKEVKPEIKQEGLDHKVKCNCCGLDSIIGIRYKCVSCPLFNMCEKCQAQVPHKHNMIKMRYIQEPQKQENRQFFGKPWWKRHHENGQHPPPPFHHPFHPPPPFGPFGHGPNKFAPQPFLQPGCASAQKNKSKDKSCDPRLKITKKCFKMSNMFKGSPKDYEEFVLKNQDLKIDELSKLYITMNKDAKVCGQAVQKVEEKTKKLAFYYQTEPQKFKQIVEKNPASNLKQLIKLINQSKQLNEKVQQAKPKQDVKQQIKSQKKQEVIISQKVVQKAQEPQVVKTSRRQIDPKKRNQFVLTMKDLFGDQDLFEYINFYNQNNELGKQELISLYIEKIQKK